MANASNFLENKLVDHLFRGTAYTAPATMYVALCTAVPSDTTTGTTVAEVSGGNYVRASIAASTANWYSTQADVTSLSTGTTGTTSNVNNISWTSTGWTGTVVAVALLDAPTLGNMLFWGQLTVAKVVSSGDTLQLTGGGGSGSLSVQLDN